MTAPAEKVSKVKGLNGADLYQGAGYVSAFYNGTFIGRAWGPACASTDWFAFRIGEDPVRLPSKDAALAHITPVVPS